MVQLETEVLSTLEWVALTARLVCIALGAVFRWGTSLFSPRNGQMSMMQKVVHPAVRDVITQCEPRQLRYIFGQGSVHQIASDVAKSKGIEAAIITLPDGTTASWLGSENAKHVIVYFYGGGYMLTPNKAQIQWLWNSMEILNEKNRDVSILVLDWDKSPENPFPRQLQQAATLIRYLINDCKRKACDIAIFGDSSGGNLCLALLSHLSHPHPSVPTLSVSENFAAMIIISPVTSWDSTSEAAIENEQYDTISRKFLEKAGAYHRNECPPNAYLEPLLADAEWWRDCKVEKILVAAGDKETLYGSIIEWLKIFEVYHKTTTTRLIGPGDTHVAPIGDTMNGTGGIQIKEINAWLLANMWVAN